MVDEPEVEEAEAEEEPEVEEAEAEEEPEVEAEAMPVRHRMALRPSTLQKRIKNLEAKIAQLEAIGILIYSP